MAMVKGSGRQVKEVYEALPEGQQSKKLLSRFPDAAPQMPINPRLNASTTIPVPVQQPRPFEKLMKSSFYRRRQRITPRDAEASVTRFCRKEMGGSGGKGDGVERKGGCGIN
jgi:hypothetical protein